jgi:hypothetical protein
MMYRRQLSEQLPDHFQESAPLSESRIPAVYHRIRFCRYTTEYTFGDIVASKDDGGVTAPTIVFP